MFYIEIPNGIIPIVNPLYLLHDGDYAKISTNGIDLGRYKRERAEEIYDTIRDLIACGRRLYKMPEE